MQKHRLNIHWDAAFAVVFLLLLTALGYAQTTATDPANILVKSGQKVVFMGDSITGMGWGDTGGYIHLVTTGLGALGVKIEPIPAGVGGNTSVHMLARLKTDALDKKPDWLLLSCGVNDVWGRGVTLDMFKTNITSIVDQARAAGIKVMILTPTPIYELGVSEFSKLSDYVAWENQLAKDRKFPVADENAAYFAYLKAQPSDPDNCLLTVDGVHPNPDGHQILATTILEAFGVTPDQMAKVKEAWLAMPDGANLPSGFGFGGDANFTITLAQEAALEKLAADKKQVQGEFLRGISMESWREELTSLPSLDGIDSYTPERAVTKMTKAKVDKLVPPDTAMPTPAPDIKTTHFDAYDVTVEKGGVTIQLHYGFRGGATITRSQWQKFKEVAASRKLTPRQLVDSTFMQAIRDTLVAHGDLSNVHQDNISGDSWPIFQKKVDAVVK
jgi:lysophospholipase L1-like esterase